MTSGVFEWRHVVTPEEIDELGHANNEAYLRWMNQAAVAHSAAQGWPVEGYLIRGEGWVVRRHEIEYLHPASPNTRLVVRTWVRNFEKASSWRCYRIERESDAVLLARGQTLWVWINYATGHLSRIPKEFKASFTVIPGDIFALRQ